jgi:chemotaxis-related protein WspB
MQVLVFELDRNRYGLDTACIRRVLPLLEMKQLAHAPPFVAGLMNYHGAPVPVIDLSLINGGRGCSACFDTRILVVDFTTKEGTVHALGLIAERVSTVTKIVRDGLVDPGVECAGGPYLGQVVAQEDGILQLIELSQLLTDEVRAVLFQPAGQTGPC